VRSNASKSIIPARSNPASASAAKTNWRVRGQPKTTDLKRQFTDITYKEEDFVFYRNMNRKAWMGPVCVFCQRGNNVFLWANGDVKNVAKCKV
jgi:hypothetical protein